MHPYRYKISLRVTHPSMSHDAISKALARETRFGWTVGDPKATPRGGAIEGIRDESYWSARLSEGLSETPIDQTLADCVGPLLSHEAFFAGLKEGGGRAELFIGLFGERNFGLELPAHFLGTCSHLGLALSMDIYPEAQP